MRKRENANVAVLEIDPLRSEETDRCSWKRKSIFSNMGCKLTVISLIHFWSLSIHTAILYTVSMMIPTILCHCTLPRLGSTLWTCSYSTVLQSGRSLWTRSCSTVARLGRPLWKYRISLASLERMYMSVFGGLLKLKERTLSPLNI